MWWLPWKTCLAVQQSRTWGSKGWGMAWLAYRLCWHRCPDCPKDSWLVESWIVTFRSFFFKGICSIYFIIRTTTHQLWIILFFKVFVFISVCTRSLCCAGSGVAGAGAPSSRGLQASRGRALSGDGAWAHLLCGTWGLPGSEMEPVSPALAGGFLTTRQQGSPTFRFRKLHLEELTSAKIQGMTFNFFFLK